MRNVPFCKPNIGQEEINAVTEVLRSGNIALGKKTEEFEKEFAEYVGAKYAVAFNGCTNALRSAIDVLNPSETISVPAITYTASASVIVESGRNPNFVDVENNLLAKDKPFIAVNLGGQRYPIDVPIIDSAHRIEKNDCINSNAIWCYSFYATKNMTTGYGGMACTNNEEQYKALKTIQNDGRIKSKPTYSVQLAVGGRDMNDIAAAMGLEQLKKLPAMTARRNEIVKIYNAKLGLNWSGNHLYPILVNNREDFIDRMAKVGIQCSIHFKPLHKEPAYKKYAKEIALPNAEYLGEHLVSLPIFPQMTDEEVEYVANEVLQTGLMITEKDRLR